jgi:murein L,D-transpeptidase YafK
MNFKIRLPLLLMLTILFFTLYISGYTSDDFLKEQKRYQRVRTAFREKESIVKNLFSNAKAQFPDPEIFIRIFKQEEMVELWAKAAHADTLILLKSYNICSTCGDLGPKRKRGDLQIPEGFYHISGFNPVSSFYLSLRINYPNASDRILGKSGDLGGDIFIHGNCVTVGCIPITDDKIKEVYLACVLAKAAGNNIPVHIFPFRMNDSFKYTINTSKSSYKIHIKFWENIKIGFDFFEKYHRLHEINVDRVTGLYLYNN